MSYRIQMTRGKAVLHFRWDAAERNWVELDHGKWPAIVQLCDFRFYWRRFWAWYEVEDSPQ